MDDLKRCPFCGEVPSSGVEFYESCGSDIKLKAIVYCLKCHVSRGTVFRATDINPVPFLDYEVAFDKAVKLWNQRWSEKPEPYREEGEKSDERKR